MSFYKPIARQDGVVEFKFQIAGENYREDYSVWDNNSKKYYRGQQFIPVAGGGVVAESTKTIPRADLEAQFPNLSKKYQFVWGIIINNTKYDFGFAKSAHDKLLECIQTARNFKIEPYEVEFIYRKTGTGLLTNHEVMSGERVGVPQNVRKAEEIATTHPYNQAGTPTPPTPSWMQQAIPQPIKPFVSQNKPIPATFVPQMAQNTNQPQSAQIQPFSKPWQGVGRQDYIQLDQDEQEILADAEKSTDKLSEVDFINGFMNALAARQKKGDVMRIVQIYRQLYTGAK